jgi:hypothetical protein
MIAVSLSIRRREVSGLLRTADIKGRAIDTADLGRLKGNNRGRPRRTVYGRHFAEHAAAGDVFEVDLAAARGPVDHAGAAGRDEIDVTGVIFFTDDLLRLAVGPRCASQGE